MKQIYPDKLYYYRLRQRARNFSVNLENKKWCDLWHVHFDTEGFGALGWVHRRRHLSALLVALSRARLELMSAKQPYQLFAVINLSDSGDDAIYVHTNNPNGTKYPIVHLGRPTHSLPPLLAGRVDLNIYRVVVRHENTSSTYVIEPRQVNGVTSTSKWGHK